MSSASAGSSPTGGFLDRWHNAEVEDWIEYLRVLQLRFHRVFGMPNTLEYRRARWAILQMFGKSNVESLYRFEGRID